MRSGAAAETFAGLAQGRHVGGCSWLGRKHSASGRPRDRQSSYLADRSRTIRAAISAMHASARRVSAFIDDPLSSSARALNYHKGPKRRQNSFDAEAGRLRLCPARNVIGF